MAADERNDENSSVRVLDQQLDQPMDEEAKRLRNMHEEKKFSALALVQVAFQSLGVVYGDLGTSPLYVFYNTFPDGIGDPEDLVEALSVIIYSLTLVALLKYVFIVCRANDNGQVGSSAVIGDGILTPAISEVVVLVAVVILVLLFSMQPYGTEALFADLSHFSVPSIQLAFTVVVFPCLLLAYCGQAAYLMKNPNNVFGAFYHSIPGFLVELKIAPTNIILRVATGTAVCVVMLVTTLLMIFVMILVWRCHWILVLIFTGLSLVVEGTYSSAVLLKVNQGGWVPLVIAAAFFIIMYVWHYGTVKRYETEMHSKVSMAWILGLGPSLGLVRVPGIGLVYTELASGVPRIFSHFITNLPAIHSVVVFVCVKYLPVFTVPEDERFLVKRIGPKNFHMLRCVVRYGYKDYHKKDDDLENKLFHNLFMFVQLESLMEASPNSDVPSLLGQQTNQSGDGQLSNNCNIHHFNQVDLSVESVDSIVRYNSPLHASNMTSIPASRQAEADEIEFLNNCRNVGVVHILGNTVVKAGRESKLWKKIAIDYLYAFLRRVCRENSVMFNVPHESLLDVGQNADGPGSGSSKNERYGSIIAAIAATLNSNAVIFVD
ncbi:hypothetical protein C1H46_037598 [Malus baccata]|uniref:Potassium transporter n=1 Tax=Malus baccata TaxID=106549 RepID=A0A540KRM3_MALBA|nr:hypothetical protein C1H46_037598 [Malus baccata]